MNEMMKVEEAYRTIMKALSTVGVERVFLDSAVGRYLAETVVAPEDSPPFDNSAMDGWAIRHADGDAPRRVVGEAAAGSPFEGVVKPGEAARIFTGAKLPEGADTVVIQENCETEGETVTPLELPSPGANIRWCGENIKSGEIILDVGERLTPGDVAILASWGRSVLSLFRAPRVAILTSGDELREVDQPSEPGSIVNSNAYMLEALVRRAGGVPVVLPIARDTMSDTRRAFADALTTADVVVSAGGVSVGDHDVVGLVIEELASADSHFWKVRMKPGKPLAFAVSERGVPIIGLPGNPVSSFVGFELFVRPALSVMQGVDTEDARPSGARARASTTFGSTSRREHYVLGRHDWRDGQLTFTAFDHQSSGNLRLLRGTTSMAVVPIGVGEVELGSMVDLVFIDGAN